MVALSYVGVAGVLFACAKTQPATAGATARVLEEATDGEEGVAPAPAGAPA